MDDFLQTESIKWRECGEYSKVVQQERIFSLETKDRCELSNLEMQTGRLIYEFEVFLPSGFSQVQEWQSFCQWHDSWDIPEYLNKNKYYLGIFMKVPPPVILLIENGNLILQVTKIYPPFVINHSCDRVFYERPKYYKDKVKVCEAKILDNSWSKFLIDISWSEFNTGVIHLNMNEDIDIKHIGPNIYNYRGNYWKLGYYRYKNITQPNYTKIRNVKYIKF